VTGGRSQNHRSTDGLQEQGKAKQELETVPKRKFDITGGSPPVPNLCRGQPEKRGVGKPREERVVGKWKRNEQTV
jgi:hypothetical protein